MRRRRPSPVHVLLGGLLAIVTTSCGGGDTTTADSVGEATIAAPSASVDEPAATNAEPVDETSATGDVPESEPAAEPATIAEVGDDTSPDATGDSAPPASASGASAPIGELDDLDEDGDADEACGIADLGGGLVVETLCNEFLRPTPEEGVLPTPASVLLLPSPSRWEDLVDVDATVKVAKAVDGRQVVIYILGSDTLFGSGQSTIRSTAQPPLAAIVASISGRFPTATVDVRGAADSVGSPAANQQLSEQRAEAVRGALADAGLSAAITTQGLGAAVPAAEELNPDGSVSEIGRQVNRRVEIVVTV